MVFGGAGGEDYGGGESEAEDLDSGGADAGGAAEDEDGFWGGTIGGAGGEEGEGDLEGGVDCCPGCAVAYPKRGGQLLLLNLGEKKWSRNGSRCEAELEKNTGNGKGKLLTVN